jgi:hypothetical protein
VGNLDYNYAVLTYATIGDTILRLATVDFAQHNGRRNSKGFSLQADKWL